MQGNGTRVLIVDDEEPLRRAYRRILADSGYDIAEADSGESALAMAAADDFDAIVCDVTMGGQSGIDVMRVLRRRSIETPVILVTGDPDLGSAIDAVEFGALRYLVKPVDARQLQRAVSKAVRLSKLGKLKVQALALLSVDAGRQDLTGELDDALDDCLSGLWMAYQPIVSSSERTIVAYEALLRSSSKRLPHPGAIFDAAEKTARLAELSTAIRDRVAADAQAHAMEAGLFVNLHPKDLLDDRLYDPAAALTPLAQRVVLEITEHASLDGIPDLRGRLADLRKLGYRIALDDLGAGYAGLTSLAALEPDFVKLDMSLTRNLERGTRRERLVSSIVDACKGLGASVVAEGIETEAERDAVIECGCDLLQGYRFARPAEPFTTTIVF